MKFDVGSGNGDGGGGGGGSGERGLLTTISVK